MMHVLKGLAAWTVAVLLLAVSGQPAHAAVVFKAFLDSAQEVAPGGATASPATATAEMRLVGDTLRYTLFFDNSFDFGPAANNEPTSDDNDITALHIHNEVRGANGPVVLGVIAPSLEADRIISFDVAGNVTVTGVWDNGDGPNPFSDFIDVFRDARPGDELPFYWNLHSEGDPAGVIRGQIAAVVPEPAALTLLGLALLGLTGLSALRHRRIG